MRLKTTTKLLPIVILVGSLFHSCQTPIEPSGASFTLVAELERTIAPSVTVESYRLTATGPSSATIIETKKTGSFTLKGLKPGTWTFIVDGFNSEGEIVASGSIEPPPFAAYTSATMSLDLSPVYGGGTGTVAISVTWPDGTRVDHVTCSLYDKYDVLSSLDLAVSEKGATYTGQLKAGHYRAVIQVKYKETNVAAPRQETFGVYTGKTISWTSVLTASHLNAAWAPGNVKAVSAGGNITMILKNDGSLWSVGDPFGGALGTNNIHEKQLIPVLVAQNVESVSVGALHTMFVKIDGSLWGCGYNYQVGALGDGTEINREVPVKVMTGVKMVSAGSYFTLILKKDDSLWTVGKNDYGQLGDGTKTNRLTPVQIMTNVSTVSAGGSHSLIVKKDGSLWSTGRNNYGQLGVASDADRATPAQVTTSGTVRAVAAGTAGSLVLLNDGTLLGSGYGLGYSSLTQIATSVVSVAAGGAHYLLVKTGGGLWVVGSNSSGQLGDGTTTNRPTPWGTVPVGVSQVAAGDSHSAYVDTAGQLWTMGNGEKGQLGLGTVLSTSTPTLVP